MGKKRQENFVILLLHNLRGRDGGAEVCSSIRNSTSRA